jgi:hypothetical protein
MTATKTKTTTTTMNDTATTATNNAKLSIKQLLDGDDSNKTTNLSLTSITNHNKKAMWFIEENKLGRCGWYKDTNTNYLVGTGELTTTTFGTSPTKIKGIGFKGKVLFRLLDTSPRLIAITKEGEKAGYGKAYELVKETLSNGSKVYVIYADTDGNLNPEGVKLYESYNETGKNVVLRTFYTLQLLDEQFNPLHSTPLVLPLHGVSSIQFSDAIKTACSQLKELYETDSYFNNNALAPFPIEIELEEGVATDGELSSTITGINPSSVKVHPIKDVEVYLQRKEGAESFREANSRGSFMTFLTQDEFYKALEGSSDKLLAPSTQVEPVVNNNTLPPSA